MKKIYAIFFFSLVAVSLHGQIDITQFDKSGSFGFYGGTTIPGENFASKDVDGLFAKNGFQIGFDLNYVISHGFAIGFNYEFNKFGFNEQEFLKFANPAQYRISRGFLSNKIGANVQYNLPIEIIKDKFTLILSLEGNMGGRTMSIPEIDLFYNELDNIYTEVSYRSRESSFGYLGYSGGLQLLFLNRFGLTISHSALMPSRHSVRYSVRKLNVSGRVSEDESYFNNFLDHRGLQIGGIIYFNRKSKKE